MLQRVLTVPLAIAMLFTVGCQAATSTATAPASPAVTPRSSALPQTPAPRGGGTREVILATTTSTQDSGLLDALVPRFETESGYTVKTISVGTGAALALGARGEADVVLVHAPEEEKAWMAQGNGTERILVMHNDFIIVGSPDDPAGIKGERDVSAALRKIAGKGSPWVSRDDNSGTDQLEKSLWLRAGVTGKGQAWYLLSGQGMGATLMLADQKNAYTITDRATYLARRGSLRAAIHLEGARDLLNLYHVMPVNPTKFPAIPINFVGARAFVDYLVKPETQSIIGEFGKDRFGQALFFADAGKSVEQVGA